MWYVGRHIQQGRARGAAKEMPSSGKCIHTRASLSFAVARCYSGGVDVIVFNVPGMWDSMFVVHSTPKYRRIALNLAAPGARAGGSAISQRESTLLRRWSAVGCRVCWRADDRNGSSRTAAHTGGARDRGSSQVSAAALSCYICGRR